MLRRHIMTVIEQGQVQRDVFGLNPILLALQTTKIVVEEIGLRRDAVLAVMLRPSMEQSVISLDEVQEKYGESVARILHYIKV